MHAQAASIFFFLYQLMSGHMRVPHTSKLHRANSKIRNAAVAAHPPTLITALFYARRSLLTHTHLHRLAPPFQYNAISLY
jgi:hypothetical protein